MNIAIIFAGGSGKRMNTVAKTQAIFGVSRKTYHNLYT